jgi:hypothetical protein
MSSGIGDPLPRLEDARLLTPALAVIIIAVVDALADLGVTHIGMPATPERVWRAIRQAAGAEFSRPAHPCVLID